jgi:hypothetical protein
MLDHPPYTTQTPWLVVLCLLSACGGGDQGWDLARVAPTNVEPQAGAYRLDVPGCFSVRSDPVSGQKKLEFSSDCFRSDLIAIDAGAFFHEHGQIGGRDCPTDGYAISGAFVSPTRAEGTLKSAFDCRVTATRQFVAVRQ